MTIKRPKSKAVLFQCLEETDCFKVSISHYTNIFLNVQMTSESSVWY